MKDCLTYQQAVSELTREDGGEFALDQQTIRGVTYSVFRGLTGNLRDYYRHGVDQFGDRDFVVYDSVRLTYSEFSVGNWNGALFVEIGAKKLLEDWNLSSPGAYKTQQKDQTEVNLQGANGCVDPSLSKLGWTVRRFRMCDSI